MRNSRGQLEWHQMDLHGINIPSNAQQITTCVKEVQGFKMAILHLSEIEYRLTNSSGNIGGCENYHIW